MISPVHEIVSSHIYPKLLLKQLTVSFLYVMCVGRMDFSKRHRVKQNIRFIEADSVAEKFKLHFAKAYKKASFLLNIRSIEKTLFLHFLCGFLCFTPAGYENPNRCLHTFAFSVVHCASLIKPLCYRIPASAYLTAYFTESI